MSPGDSSLHSWAAAGPPEGRNGLRGLAPTAEGLDVWRPGTRRISQTRTGATGRGKSAVRGRADFLLAAGRPGPCHRSAAGIRVGGSSCYARRDRADSAAPSTHFGFAERLSEQSAPAFRLGPFEGWRTCSALLARPRLSLAVTKNGGALEPRE